MLGFGRKRAHDPLFVVEDYEIDKSIDELSHRLDLRPIPPLPKTISFKDGTIFEAPPAGAFEMEWKMVIGAVDGHIYKIALFWDGENRNTAGRAILRVFNLCTRLFGDPIED